MRLIEALKFLSWLLVLVFPTLIETNQLSDNVRPTAQIVKLNIDVKNSNYKGKVNISFQVLGSWLNMAKRISLNAAENLKIYHVYILQRKQIKDPIYWLYEKEFDHDMEQGILNILIGDDMIPGETYTIEIEFSSRIGLNSSGIKHKTLTRLDGRRVDIIFANGSKDNASRIFPCFSDEKFKTPIILAVRRDQNYKVITNSLMSRINEDGSLIKYQPTQPMSMSSFMLLLTNELEYREGNYGNTHIKVNRFDSLSSSNSLEQIIDIHKQVSDKLKEYFGSELPMKKIEYIGLPDLGLSVQAYERVIAIDMTKLTIDYSKSKYDKTVTSFLIGCGLSQSWLGSSNCSPSKSTDRWFVIGLAHLLGLDIIHAFENPDKPSSRQLIEYHTRWLDSDPNDYASLTSIHQNIPTSIDIDLINVGRSTSVMYLLVHYFAGKDKFRQYLTDLLKSCSIFDPIRSMRHFLGPEIENNLKGWLSNPGYPVLSIDIDYESLTLRFRQNQFGYQDSDSQSEYLWSIPIVIIDYCARRGIVKNLFIIPARKLHTLRLDRYNCQRKRSKPQIIIEHAPLAPYRISLSQNMVKTLGHSLSDYFMPIHSQHRIFIDTLKLVESGHIGVHILIGLFEHLSQTSDMNLLQNQLNNIRQIIDVFIGTDLFIPLIEHIVHLLRGFHMNNNLFQSSKGLDQGLVREHVASMLVQVNDSNFVGQSLQLFDYSENIEKIPATIIGPVICAVANHGTEEQFEKILNFFASSNSLRMKRAIWSLGYIDSDSKLREIVYILKESTQLKSILLSMSRSILGQRILIDMITSNEIEDWAAAHAALVNLATTWSQPGQFNEQVFMKILPHLPYQWSQLLAMETGSRMARRERILDWQPVLARYIKFDSEKLFE